MTEENRFVYIKWSSVKNAPSLKKRKKEKKKDSDTYMG